MLALLLSLVPQANVVVVVLDDVAWADFQEVDTPHLDALASQGMLFTRAYGQPWCRPYRKSLLFMENDGASHGSMCKAPGTFSLAQLPSFPESMTGYATGLFGKWHLGNNNDPFFSRWETPNFHGFDTWRAGVPDNIINTGTICNAVSYDDWFRVDDGVTSSSTDYNTFEIFYTWVNWWLSTPAPRFAVVSFQAVHAPFHEPPLLPPGYQIPVPTSNRDYYEAMLASLDLTLASLTALAKSDTYVIVMGDNGSPPDAIPSGVDANKVKHTVFERGVRVPLIVTGPGISPGVSSNPVSVTDIAATVFDLTGIPADPVDGVSFAPILHGNTPLKDWAYVRTNRGNKPGPKPDEAVIELRWKLRDLAGVQTLYDLTNDPMEIAPLDPDDPAYAVDVQRLRDRLAESRE